MKLIDIKLIALDFDGVLNSSESYNAGFRDKNGIAALSPEHVMRLNKILQATDAFIVISSSWRHFHTHAQNIEFLVAAGFSFPQRILGDTSKNRFVFRGEEILEWMDCWQSNNLNPKINKFIILDDLDLIEFRGLEDHVISTTWFDGLQDEHVNKAIKRLNED